MINRENWELARAYLAHRIEIDSISSASSRLEKTWLRHVLEWADERPFYEAPRIRPTFPTYLLSARRDGKEAQLSSEYSRKVISAARHFFEWLSVHRAGYKALGGAWLETLKRPRSNERPTEHEAVTLEEILEIARAPVMTYRDKRIRAAAVFWFLSGIRIGAFVSLPLLAVDLDERQVKQWPSLGVRTKFGKHATTYLLDIPDLLAVVREWDDGVRALLPPQGLWFAPLSSETGEIDPNVIEAGNHRDARARKDLRDWCRRVGLTHHSPHKFRNGHAVYGLKHAQTVADYKAVSQNLMHADLKVTDGIYAILSNNDVGERIGNLSHNAGETPMQNGDLIAQLEGILDQLKGKK